MQVGNEGEGNIDALYGFGDLDELDKKSKKYQWNYFHRFTTSDEMEIEYIKTYAVELEIVSA